MRTLLVLTLAFLPLLQAQDSRPIKSVEPRYDLYSEDLAEGFDVASASVTLAIQADGRPFALSSSSVPLPMAVVMALKDYEFQPQSITVPHGRSLFEAPTYQVTLNVPIRQRKEPQAAARRINPGVAKGNVLTQVKPIYPEAGRHARIQGKIIFEAVITEQGYIESLKTSSGPFMLIEAAYDAVKLWQYKPYLLNGERIEVMTSIEVNFNLN